MKDSVNIFLVDDDIRNLDVLESVLTMPDYRLFRARSADEALLALVREEFAVIVLDVRMPDLSGYELAQLIKGRKRTQHVPIIFLTAYYGEDEDVLQGYGAGAVDYLSKPVNPLILRSKVAVLVDLFRKTRTLETMNRAMEAEIEERLAQLKASLHEKDTLLREVHHRVKNNLQIVSSLIDLQAARQKSRDVQALFRDARDRVRSMALVHEKLYQSEDLAQTELGTYTKNLMKELFQAHGEVSSKIRLNMQLEPVRLPVDRAIPCGLILNELATNSLKHAFIGRQEGLIEICLTSIGNRSVRLVFQDDGKGFPSGFNWHATESLGLRLVRMLSEQLERISGIATDREPLLRSVSTSMGQELRTPGSADGESEHSYR